MDDEEREFKVVASKTVTATFTVWAEDEDDAKFMVENAVSDYEVEVSDAQEVDNEDWDVLSVEEQT